MMLNTFFAAISRRSHIILGFRFRVHLYLLLMPFTLISTLWYRYWYFCADWLNTIIGVEWHDRLPLHADWHIEVTTTRIRILLQGNTLTEYANSIITIVPRIIAQNTYAQSIKAYSSLTALSLAELSAWVLSSRTTAEHEFPMHIIWKRILDALLRHISLNIVAIISPLYAVLLFRLRISRYFIPYRDARHATW